MLLRFLADSLNYSDFIKGIEKLTVAQMEVLYVRLQEELRKRQSKTVSSPIPVPETAEQTKKIVKIVTEKLVIKPKSVVECCLRCGSVNIKKKGFTKGKVQRYLCHDCGKTFSENYGLITHYTHLSEWQWQEIIRGIVCQLSITEISKNIGVSTSTVWSCRMKVYQTIKNIYGYCDTFNSIVEADGKYERISFKGCKDKDYFIDTLGRIPRHHRSRRERFKYIESTGKYKELFKNNSRLLKEMVLGSQKKMAGLNNIDKNHQQVCIVTAVDRNNNMYIEPITAGTAESSDIYCKLHSRVSHESILITDDHHSYKLLARKDHIEHIKVSGGTYVSGAYNLARINSLHSSMDRFFGSKEYYPATKYLDLYLMMFWWLQKNKEINKNDQNHLLFSIMTGCVDSSDRAKMSRVTIKELVTRELPIDTKGYY